MDVHQSRKSSNLQTRRRVRSKNNGSIHEFESDIVPASKIPVVSVSGRRMWTFKGTGAQPKRTLSSRPTGRRPATANSSRRTSLSVRPKRTSSMVKLTRSIETPLLKESERVGRSRSKSTRLSHSQLSQQLEIVRSKPTTRSRSQHSQRRGSARSKSRASSAANSSVGSVANVNSVDIDTFMSEEDGLPAANDDRNKVDLPALNTQLNIDTNRNEQLLRNSPAKALLPEEVLVRRLQRPESPCVISYRKIVYNEKDNKWVEYEKLCENEDFYADRMKREHGFGLPPLRSPIIEKPRRVKGRMTERMQLMFPTALVLDNRDRKYYEKLKLTDKLRLELHKRHVPVVPTHFQKHILKFGKLPFRNNPRPHLIY